MIERTVKLGDEQVQALERLAAEDDQSVDVLVRQAVDAYLAQRRRAWADWDDRFDAFVGRIQSQLPPDILAAEKEADITAARAEVRAERAVRRAIRDRPDADRR